MKELDSGRAAVATATRLPRGDEVLGEIDVTDVMEPLGSPRGAVGGSLPVGVQKTIGKLLFLAVHARDLVVAELKRYREVSEEDWPLPIGYRFRLAPAFIAHLFSRHERSEDFVEDFITNHGLQDCYTAKEMLNYAGILDKLLLIDRFEGFINLASTEYLCRRLYGLQLAFEKCRTKEDWKRPEKAPKWKSKVDWRMCDRVDPRAKESSKVLDSREMQAELRVEMEREALLAKVQNKLDRHLGDEPDRFC